MKNQYFGDINDYRKYGLLRAIIHSGEFRLLVAWMLTPDDDSEDGKFVSYLQEPDRWSHHDPTLFEKLQELSANKQQRRVALIEATDLLSESEYFSIQTPDSASDRSSWFQSLAEKARGCDFVFLDPDNGLEVRSKRYGSRHSSKYLYWREVEALWSSGKSLLIYQHFIREQRDKFLQRMLERLKGSTPDSAVVAFSTSHVVFLMALQPKHQCFHGAITTSVQKSWEGQIGSGE